jgi:hypothetical protein
MVPAAPFGLICLYQVDKTERPDVRLARRLTFRGVALSDW